MSILIDQQRCIGCGKCSDICPGSLIETVPGKKAVIIYPRDCWGCTACLKECPTGAISFYLGADIGGQGGSMHIEKNGYITKWIIQQPDKEPITIETDSRTANKY
ncbi:4Fe-4S dicluster domain-containing protein [Pectinatus frisingensis]|uniref:4Fe-4S dicluster domain-containing protein n=1 Tax=Pectinatus frisingensis TaxID=865 RepID=UPI0018C6BFC0|nr:ferredoxin family protein [Pectinatus frisingensis]